MDHTPITLAKGHVLGSLYWRCEAISESVPVYMSGDEQELLGHASEASGTFADAISFHLDGDLCKKLAAGHFSLAVDYSPLEPDDKSALGRVIIHSFTLVGRKNYEKPIPRR
jgi:hypothetical protein